MKILSVVAAVPPYRGGLAHAAYREACSVAHHPSVERYTLLTMGPHGEDQALTSTLQQVVIKPLWRNGLAGSILRRIGREIKQHDIIYLHYPFFGTNEVVAFFALLYKKPLIIRYHMDAHDPGWRRVLYWPYQKIWLPFFLKAADKVIFSSFEYAASSVAASFFKKHRNLCAEIPFGVDTQFFSPGAPDPALIARYHLRPDARRILFVGGLDRAHYFKGVSVLLDAFTTWQRRQKELWELVIVGDGDCKEIYERYAQKNGILKAVHFLGRVPDEDLPGLYRSATFFTLPSLDSSEAFGIVLVESLSCGTPVIASNLPGVSSIIHKTDGGAMAAPGNVSDIQKAWEMVNERLRRETSWRTAFQKKTVHCFDERKNSETLLHTYVTEGFVSST